MKWYENDFYNRIPHDETRTCRLLAAMMCLYYSSFISPQVVCSKSEANSCLLMNSSREKGRFTSLIVANNRIYAGAQTACVFTLLYMWHTNATCTTATHRMMHGTTTSPLPPGMDDGLIWSCDPWTRHSCQVSWCNVLLPIGPFYVWSDDDAVCPVPAHRSCYAWLTPAWTEMLWHLPNTPPNLTSSHQMNVCAGLKQGR
jgi:hypothetical protein